MSRQYNRRRWELWIALVALAMFSIPFVASPQHEPAPPVTGSTVEQPPAYVEEQLLEKPSDECEKEAEEEIEREKGDVEIECPKSTDVEIEREKPAEAPATISCDQYAPLASPDTTQTHVVYHLGEMLNDGEEWIGKTITVDGEMHRQFTDKVFTIEDDGFLRDRDMLVISVTPMNESVIPLEDSFERGKKVRVTGVVRPYDQAQLECLYGPLNLESREGKSFTKNPVLIIGYRPPTPVAVIIEEKPAPLPEPPPPAPAVELPPPPPPAPAPEPEPVKALPRTASDVPFAAAAGVFFIFAAGLAHLLGRTAVRSKR